MERGSGSGRRGRGDFIAGRGMGGRNLFIKGIIYDIHRELKLSNGILSSRIEEVLRCIERGSGSSRT